MTISAFRSDTDYTDSDHIGFRPWWDYPKFRHDNVKVLIVSLQHLLLKEICSALERLGHKYKLLLIREEENSSVVEQIFAETIKNFKPDFVLTINHMGFDHEGRVANLLTQYRVPFASWYVDSPHLIIRYHIQNNSPYLTLFLWDQDYLETVKKLGFESVEYLPLGTDEKLFRPLQISTHQTAHLLPDVGFVGNSMVIKARSRLARTRINGDLQKRFGEIAATFERSGHLIVRDMLAEEFPDLSLKFEELSESQAIGYETAVTWHATGRYRLALVKKLRCFKPLIVGDTGWREILDHDFRFHSELNYYTDLPAFYNITKVNFNATSLQMKQGVNQRVFDVTACRSMVITDTTRQLEALMEPGREIIAYRNADEIPELVNRALKDNIFRKNIIAAGYKRVLNEHTYRHRVNRLINVMKRNYK